MAIYWSHNSHPPSQDQLGYDDFLRRRIVRDLLYVNCDAVDIDTIELSRICLSETSDLDEPSIIS